MPKAKKPAPAPSAPRTVIQQVVTPEGTVEEVEVPAPPQAVVIPPEQLSQVVMFLENAFSAGTEPAVVAQTAKTIAPAHIPAIVQAIVTGGVDAFLDQVAGLNPTGPLAQQGGRTYLRRVAKALRGDTDE